MNKFFAKLPFKGLAEKLIPAGARTKVPLLESIVIPFANQIVCGFVVLIMIVGIASCGGKSRSASGSASAPDSGSSSGAESRAASNVETVSESDFTFRLTDDNQGVIILRYNGKATQLRFPATIQGFPVIGIGGVRDSGNYPNRTVTSVEIPEGVTFIGNEAFSVSTALRSISLPSTLTSIGERAFEGCVALTSISLPAGLREIGELAFGGSGLTSFPNPWPRGIIALPFQLFLGSKLQTAVIPEGIIYIESRAFFECADLTSITLPSSIRYIGDTAFARCRSLTTVNIPESVNNLPLNRISQDKLQWTGFVHNAFEGCSNLPLATQVRIRQIIPNARF